MRSRLSRWGFVSMALVVGCGGGVETKTTVVSLQPGPDIQKQTQKALIEAKPGTVIEFSEGTFDFTGQLSLSVDGVTIRGKGIDKTILSFKKQDQGSEGILVTGNNFTIEDLAVEDAKGDGVKVNGAKGVVFRNIRAEWTGGPDPKNGAYGLYPVQCDQVLIEGCVAIGASDAGLYVGQSQNIIVRNCRAERNVAGIEIENSSNADVYDNVATNNTGGLLIFDLPGLPVKNGRNVRVFNNKVYENNHDNFAPPGNLVATIPPGTGLMVMATDNVEVFGNESRDHKTMNMSIISYLFTQKPFEDKEYDPVPEGIYVHDNVFANGGTAPSGPAGLLLAPLVGKPLPDIIYDGVVNPNSLVDGQVPPEKRVYIENNGDATFANINLPKLDLKAAADTLSGKSGVIDRDVKNYAGQLPRLKEVKLEFAATGADGSQSSGGGGD